MSDEEYELITSPLSQTVSLEGETVQVEIYRGVDDKGWVLEVVDKYGNSAVWDDLFDTDNAAYKEVLSTIELEGIQSLIGSPSKSQLSANTERPIDVSLRKLDELFCSEDAPETVMDAPTLEGFLTALVIGSNVIPPSQYMPWIWDMENGKEEMVYDSMEQVQETMSLVMEVWNDIAETFSTNPTSFEPSYFRAVEWGASEWCEGFLLGTQLVHDSWTSLLLEKPKLITPFLRLGDDIGIELTQEEKNHEKWMYAVPDALVDIHGYWLEHRMDDTSSFPAMPVKNMNKVGRNDPCTCGSGKKYKKCCGVPPTIH